MKLLKTIWPILLCLLVVGVGLCFVPSLLAPANEEPDFPPLSQEQLSSCPAAEPQRWSKPGQAQRVLGPGPVHPIADYFSGGALPLRPSDRQADGSYTVKVRWLAADYTGPTLLHYMMREGACLLEDWRRGNL